MRKEQASDPSTAQQPAGNQQPQDALPLLAAFLPFALVFLVFPVFLVLLAALAQQMGKEQASDPATAQQPAGNQQLQDAMLLVAAFLGLVTKDVLVSFLPTT